MRATDGPLSLSADADRTRAASWTKRRPHPDRKCRRHPASRRPGIVPGPRPQPGRSPAAPVVRYAASLRSVDPVLPSLCHFASSLRSLGSVVTSVPSSMMSWTSSSAPNAADRRRPSAAVVPRRAFLLKVGLATRDAFPGRSIARSVAASCRPRSVIPSGQLSR